MPFCRSPLPELPERGRRHSLSDIPQVLAPNEEGMLMGPLDFYLFFQKYVGAMPEDNLLNDGPGSYAESGKAKSEPQSFQESLDMMRDNAKKSGDAMAQLNFARYLFESAEKIMTDHTQLGLEVPDDETKEARLMKMASILEQEGIKWIRRLATYGPGNLRHPLAEAQFLLAEYIGTGLYGLKINHQKAFNLYIQASKQNHSQSAFRVAVCYELGAGTKQDNMRGVQFYRKAASLGDNLAMHKLALTLLYGKLGQKRNLKEGMSWLKRAANNADVLHPEPLHDLAQCFEKHGGCPIVIPDEYYAFELYSRAANFGFAPSQFRLGACYELGLLGVEPDAALSIKWYGKAAAQGYPEAELALAGWYLDGAPKILERNELTAFRWVKKAAERGYPKAFYVMGTYYERGIGVQPNEAEANRLFKIAADGGYKKAMQRLEQPNGSKRQGKCTIM